MKKLSYLFLVLLIFTDISTYGQSPSLKHVATCLSGSYSSKSQSVSDTSYFNISLQIIPIWKERTDGYWFYVEQAMASLREKPYRQRVYHLTENSTLGTYESAIYTLFNPLRFALHSEMVNELSPDSLQLKDGCTVVLKWNNEEKYYQGSTGAKSCPSDLRGASYAVSEVQLYENKLVSWDKGFDKSDKQVWGAIKGGYQFDKLNSEERK